MNELNFTGSVYVLRKASRFLFIYISCVTSDPKHVNKSHMDVKMTLLLETVLDTLRFGEQRCPTEFHSSF